ncbi:hypothetical protein EZ313_16870 [Ramlibacter henchirensis]|uniref:Uncharacterized protein n=1 Tax=Ramlibacter henchirensis TaxID=204072 RepID=A0A4Z0BUA8_9BURK|nr:hypothetical protein [Ramlibacter henchirensis]TFZ02907.1 hypothetical protein EZ313_16870 [Ramlibacter henchirensis]
MPAAWKRLPRAPELVEAWNRMQRSVRQALEGQRSGTREAYLLDHYGTTAAAMVAHHLSMPRM